MQGEDTVPARTIRQYCSVCKATLEMAVVDTVPDNEVTWLKCPRCNGILPHMMSEEPAAVETASSQTEEATTGASGFDAAEREAAVDYEASGSYEVGQLLYHRSFNAYGRVIEKTVLPGNRAAIRVRFEDGEEMMLREQV